jgi:uncharacterized protein
MKRIMLGSITLYRRGISPLFPPSCRFTPTCSQYAFEAIDRFGPIKGTRLAAWRILRCNPLVPGGYDPVPACDCGRSHEPPKTKPSSASPQNTGDADDG